MKTLKIFHRKGEINDATAYYVETVATAFREKGYQVSTVAEVNAIQKSDLVLVITMKSFLQIYFHYHRQQIVMWFQGIVPEEARMLFSSHWSREFRYCIWSLCERFVLKKSKYLFFVSGEMVAHYAQKYNFKRKEFYIMPCFNLPLNENSFVQRGKYETPSFVYAGTLSCWQCIGQTLQLYRAIGEVIPESRFTLLTAEIDKGLQLVEQYGLHNAEVKYVAPADLPVELQKYKYGFLLRENTAVNNVSTPTKLNSYMASGVIPIYSDVIRDFSHQFSAIGYLIKAKDINNPESVVEQIMKNEQQPIDSILIKSEFKKVFDQYYSRDYHVAQIGNQIGLIEKY